MPSELTSSSLTESYLSKTGCGKYGFTGVLRNAQHRIQKRFMSPVDCARASVIGRDSDGSAGSIEMTKEWVVASSLLK